MSRIITSLVWFYLFSFLFYFFEFIYQTDSPQPQASMLFSFACHQEIWRIVQNLPSLVGSVQFRGSYSGSVRDLATVLPSLSLFLFTFFFFAMFLWFSTG